MVEAIFHTLDLWYFLIDKGSMVILCNKRAKFENTHNQMDSVNTTHESSLTIFKSILFTLYGKTNNLIMHQVYEVQVDYSKSSVFLFQFLSWMQENILRVMFCLYLFSKCLHGKMAFLFVCIFVYSIKLWGQRGKDQKGFAVIVYIFLRETE